MAFIIESPNPFQPLKEMRKHEHPGGITIRGWLELTYPGFQEFNVPTICMVNGEAVMRKDWNKEIQPKDVVNFIAVAGVPLVIIAIVILVVALAVTLALTMSLPKTPGAAPDSDPVFSTKGQSNTIRLGEPIEVNYGKNRIYPSLASRPFYRYQNNDQFQHSLFVIGQGEYEIHAVQIGEADISDYQEVEYEIVEPGQQTTLFATNVYSAPEVGSIDIPGTNEPEWGADGYQGPFDVCLPGDTVYRIEVDIVYPKGIYKMNNQGQIEGIQVDLQIQIRLIDDAGAPLGSWTDLFTPSIFAYTTTPQRFTYGSDVAVGRYEIKARRTTTKLDSTRVGYDSIWEGIRGFVEGGEPDFGNVTLLAVAIRATNNLNSRTQDKFNVIATRKLMQRDSSSGIWYGPVATRSITWAFVDIFRSLYGARVTDDSFFDWETLEELDALYEYRNEHFDWTFRDPITVWEAAQAVARAGRAVPLLMGSLISIKRDGPVDIPVTLFNPDNIVQGSFQWQVKLWEPLENDSLAVEYTDPNTGYKQEIVVCGLPGGTTDNPKDIRIPGIADRNHAYHEGLYILASERYLRENIVFETGLEGLIPSFGDLIAIAHDVPRWGQSGYIVHVEDLGGSDYQLYVSEPLLFEETGDYQILLRSSTSAPLGPFTARQTADSKQVIINVPGGTDFLLGGSTEPMLFLFGVAGSITKYGKVVKVEPQGGERVRITAVNDAPEIHQFDGLEAPDLDSPSIPPEIPAVPVIAHLFLSQIDSISLVIQAAWTATFGATYYTIQTSQDAGVAWEDRGTTTRASIQLQVVSGDILVRVAAIGTAQGPWIQDSISVGLWILAVGAWEDSGWWEDDHLWEDN